jgi:hypothetical protein
MQSQVLFSVWVPDCLQQIIYIDDHGFTLVLWIPIPLDVHCLFRFMDNLQELWSSCFRLLVFEATGTERISIIFNILGISIKNCGRIWIWFILLKYKPLLYDYVLRAGWSRFDSWQCKIFLFPTVSKSTLGPTQPPFQWVPGALSPGGKAVEAWSWALTSI